MGESSPGQSSEEGGQFDVVGDFFGRGFTRGAIPLSRVQVKLPQ